MLNGAWRLEIPGSGYGCVPAVVPGSVYHDLLSAKLIPDPFYRDNETEALKLMENDFHYSRSFEVGRDLLECGAVLLRCVLFCAPKHFRFEDPQLAARIEGDEIVVTAKAYARSVEIQAGADTLLSDNYFDMNTGERRVRILKGSPERAAARSVYDIR